MAAPRDLSQSAPAWLILALLPLAFLGLLGAGPWPALVNLEVWHLGPPDRLWLYTLTWSKHPWVFGSVCAMFLVAFAMAVRTFWTHQHGRALVVLAASLVCWLGLTGSQLPGELGSEKTGREYASALTLELGACATLVVVVVLAISELRLRGVHALLTTSCVGALLAWAVLALRLRRLVFMRWADAGAWWLDIPVLPLAGLALVLALVPVARAIHSKSMSPG